MRDADQPADRRRERLRGYHLRAREVLGNLQGWGTRPVGAVALMHELPVKGGQMVLLTLERWSAAFAITWFFAADGPSDEIDLRLQGGLVWRATDDVGRDYEGFDVGGGGGNSPHWRATTWFAPWLGEGVENLTVAVTSPVDDLTITDDVAIPRMNLSSGGGVPMSREQAIQLSVVQFGGHGAEVDRVDVEMVEGRYWDVTLHGRLHWGGRGPLPMLGVTSQARPRWCAWKRLRFDALDPNAARPCQIEGRDPLYETGEI